MYEKYSIFLFKLYFEKNMCMKNDEYVNMFHYMTVSHYKVGNPPKRCQEFVLGLAQCTNSVEILWPNTFWKCLYWTVRSLGIRVRTGDPVYHVVDCCIAGPQ
jgi:hypothetical protein